MSGHNKWSSIKHKKGAADAKRGKVFTKVIREITVAARMGGGDISGNPRLRAAVALGKSENMPKDNIDRAIKKGTGELEGVSYEEANYEGYGPGGVAVLVDCLTDNKNRTVADVKHLFERYGGSLGEPGCVAYMFEKKGLIVIEKDKVDEEELLDLVLEAGAEDVKEEETEFNVITDASDFESVKKAVDDAGIPNTFAEVTMIPQNTVEVEGKKAQQIFNLIEALEDVDDVSNVYANFDMSDEVMEALG
ncbi:MAG: YebC/PmpR family DNA-binding transcriptional regulator [Deltaproteobacteria bacterium]|nr:YebC/PmpR family DNA-binding transcriptional regulator [Deltaproteobacteria bacterium]MBW2216332.1 YebC/PmpR family DNA-binding transcriptional regulator [Deltaproteobacteria bacterium]